MNKNMAEDMFKKLAYSVETGNQNEAIELCEESIRKGLGPVEAIVNGLSKGMALVSEKFDRHEYFVPELLQAARAMKSGLEVLKPHIKVAEALKPAKVMIGTVQDDMHDIGKNILVLLLEVAGHEVIDLGVDVSKETFLSKAKETLPQVLGMSALLTTTMPQMKEVIALLNQEGIRDKIQVIVGGAPVTQKYADEIGADAYGENGPDAIRKIAALLAQ